MTNIEISKSQRRPGVPSRGLSEAKRKIVIGKG
jgi:hypothetical protein